ncbi:hypothetical protein HAX54_025525, partial [Datura stramonium]|nr:hypothetical protein [Datura stramonium]
YLKIVVQIHIIHGLAQQLWTMTISIKNYNKKVTDAPSLVPIVPINDAPSDDVPE